MLCDRNLRFGSNRIGYETRARNEPVFEAEYKKYGSRPDVSPVCQNHFCNIGALLETMKKGRRTRAARQASSHKDGLPVRGTESTQNSLKPIGKDSSASPNKSSCTTSCCLNLRVEMITA